MEVLPTAGFGIHKNASPCSPPYPSTPASNSSWHDNWLLQKLLGFKSMISQPESDELFPIPFLIRLVLTPELTLSQGELGPAKAGIAADPSRQLCPAASPASSLPCSLNLSLLCAGFIKGLN